MVKKRLKLYSRHLGAFAALDVDIKYRPHCLYGPLCGNEAGRELIPHIAEYGVLVNAKNTVYGPHIPRSVI